MLQNQIQLVELMYYKGTYTDLELKSALEILPILATLELWAKYNGRAACKQEAQK